MNIDAQSNQALVGVCGYGRTVWMLVTATDETYFSLERLEGSRSADRFPRTWAFPSPWYLARFMIWKFDGLLGQRMLVHVENGRVQSCALLGHEMVSFSIDEYAEYTNVDHQEMVRRLLSSTRLPSAALASRQRRHHAQMTSTPPPQSTTTLIKPSTPASEELGSKK